MARTLTCHSLAEVFSGAVTFTIKSVTDRFYPALDECGEVRAIALDTSKAFDKFWHTGLLHKLSSSGVLGNIFKINEYFFSNRSIKVVLDSQHTFSFPVTSGVPKGLSMAQYCF